MTQQAIEIILQILLIIIGLYLAFFKSYFQEKGKNLATLEDIEEITKLVEQVKISFIKQTENLKANLQFLTNVQVGIASEERNAIIDYNLKYFRWLNLLLDSSMGDVNTYDDIELDKYMQLQGDYYRDLLDNETKFGLFVDNKELIDTANQLKIQTLKLLAPHPSNCAMELKKNNSQIEYLKKTVPFNEQSEKHSELLERRKAIREEFRKQLISNYKTLVSLTKQFQKQSREHIYKLVETAKNETIG